MLTARRLSLAVQLVLASSTAFACGGSDGTFASSLCKTLAEEANPCVAKCTAESTVSLSYQGLCDAEKSFFAAAAAESLTTYPKLGLDCARLCGSADAACELADPHDDVLRSVHPVPLTAFDGGCPFAAKVGPQLVYCDQTVRPESNACVTEGRRPAGWTAAGAATGTSAAGSYLASCAELEAISVFAFRELRDELAWHGAPQHLLDACARAADDEVVHAQRVGDLARRHGAEPPRVVREPRGERRALVDIAIDNAVEGCVRELFGAAQALFRAQRARTEEARSVMQRVAEDEARHADLSLTLGDYLATRLDDAQRARVRRAADAARAELRGALAERATDPSLHALGVPTREEALALYDALAATFWGDPRMDSASS